MATIRDGVIKLEQNVAHMTSRHLRYYPIILATTAVGALCAVEVVPVLSNLVTRSKWGGGETGKEKGSAGQIQEQTEKDVRFITIHNFGCPKDQELIRMKSNRDLHVRKNYGDIAYHYIVGDSGKVYEGRRPTLAPASFTYYLNDEELKTKVTGLKKGEVILDSKFAKSVEKSIPGNTKGHITVSLMCGGKINNKGDLVGNPELLKTDAMNTVANLVAELLIKYDLKPKDVRAHRELASTDCPNDEVYKWLRGENFKKEEEGPGLTLIRERFKVLGGTE